jgi:maltooligosyltrehalose trehalohydrolase
LIKEGFVEATSELFGRRGFEGGLAISWRTAQGNLLQIVTNFSDGSLALPKLIAGETIWPRHSLPEKIMRPSEIIVRCGRRSDRR